MANSKKITRKPKLLWIGDAVAHTGFSTVTHAILDRLRDWDVNVLGVNYHGDPHPYPYKIWPASRQYDDIYGVKRLPNLLRDIQPDVVCVLNDPWVMPSYIKVIKGYNEFMSRQYEEFRKKDPRTVRPKPVRMGCYTPVDALNIYDFAPPLNDLDFVVAYTNFGLTELQKGGLTTKAAVIPHGIDPNDFKPVPKSEARKRLNLPEDWFIVGNVNRNQPRKRLDLFFQYFAEWSYNKPENVKLYYHGALEDVGWHIESMSRFFGIADRLIITSDRITSGSGVPKHVLRDVYNSFDVQVSTTMGEGWGLTTMEGMACGVPQILPDWSALGEWARDAAELIPCTAIGMHTGGLNTVGGLADKEQFIEALEKLYVNADYRSHLAKAGRELVSRPEFKWSTIARSFDAVFKEAMNEH